MTIYWKRIIIAGIAVELLYAVYVYFLATADLVGYKPEGLAVAFVLFALGGFWAARPASQGRLAIGAATGLVGILFYYALQAPNVISGAQEYPLMAWVNHGLKVAGGVAGALLAGLSSRKNA